MATLNQQLALLSDESQAHSSKNDVLASELRYLREQKASLQITLGDQCRDVERRQDRLVQLQYDIKLANEDYDVERKKEITLDLQTKDMKALNKELEFTINMEATKLQKAKDERDFLEKDI